MLGRKLMQASRRVVGKMSKFNHTFSSMFGGKEVKIHFHTEAKSK